MAASLTTIGIIEREGAAAHAEHIGNALLEGLAKVSSSNGIEIDTYPEPIAAMPFMRFKHSDPLERKRRTDIFYREVLAQGVLLHPRHLWFPSLAHTTLDVEKTLEAADAGMKAVVRTL
jgi:glutamate-1-semialdehyde aminotransferase